MEVQKASVKTVLRLGRLETPVGLFKASGDPEGTPEFEKAGPNGGVLEPNVEEVDPGGELLPAVADALQGDPEPQTEGTPVAPYREAGTGMAVQRDEVRRGVRLEDGEFVDLTEHLEDITTQAQLDGLEVAGFIRREKVPRERICGAYYLGVADGIGPSPARVLAVLYEAMKRKERVAVVRWTKRKNTSLGVLVPRGKALMVLEVEWAQRWREPNDKCLAHQAVNVQEAEVDAAAKLVEALSESRQSLDDLQDARPQMERELYDEAMKRGGVMGTPAYPFAEKEVGDIGKLLAASVGGEAE